MAKKIIRAAVKTVKGNTRPAHGEELPDGSFKETHDQKIHLPGSWFKSRQAGSCEQNEEEEE